MIALRRLGFREWWRNDSKDGGWVFEPGRDLPLPSLFESTRSQPQPNEAELILYLENAPFIHAWMSVERDVINPDRWIPGGLALQTDGVWNWNFSLSYYVREYHAQLPEEFVEYARASNWTIPPISIDQLGKLGDQFLTSKGEHLE